MAALSIEIVARGAPMSERLGADLESTSKLSIAVAYAKQSALSAVNLTEWIGPGRNLRLLAGTDFALTELELLKRLESRQSGSCRVYHSRAGSNFHPKLYVLDKPDSRVIYVGSSNLTRGGLKGNVEANVRIEAERDAPEAVEALSVFDGLYDGEFATPVDGDFERRYSELQKARREAERRWTDTEPREHFRAAEAMLLGRYRAGVANTRWLLVVTPENYDICMRTNTWGRRKQAEIVRYQAGDVFFFYVSEGRGIAAMGMFTGAPYRDDTPLWPDDGKGPFPWRIGFMTLGELRTSIPARELLEPLKPGMSKGWWGGFVTASHSLQAQDFSVLREAFETTLRADRGWGEGHE